MVVISRNQDAQTQQFVIRPNSSLSWRQLIVYFSVIAGTCLSVALYSTLKGAWMVLPFAGLEVLLLGVAFYLSARRCSIKEVINISADTLYIERGRYRIEQQFEFQTAWTKVILTPSEIRHYPSKLLIGSHGKSVEIACDLCEEEKKQLADDLQASVREAIKPIT